jgi:hypothetical protein
MAEQIIDGTGTGQRVKIDNNNQLHTFSITETEQQQATDKGNSYNLNTGWVTISADSAVMYFKNDEDLPFVIDAVAVGFKTGTQADIGTITLVRNPTAGTLIDAATNVDMNQNRNFGSSKTLKSTSLAYKATASGQTFTDGDDIAIFAQSDTGRLFATIDFELPKGSSVGVQVDPNLSSGTIEVYVALIGYLKDVDNS